MTAKQLDLVFSQTDVSRMTELLQNVPDGQPIRAAEFGRLFGWTDRKCRAVAEGSFGAILGTQQGYVLNDRISDTEFAEWQEHWRKSFIRGLARVRQARLRRYGERQELFAFLREMIGGEV
jgi:hypothetical protein